MEIGEKRIDAMANTMSKSELIQRIVDGHPNEIARKDVKGVIDAVAAIGHKELKKTGAFVVPGLAKFIVIKTTKARQGINPFTKEPTTFKAKPARKIVRARPVKAAKDAVA
jgi:DNA-binding protein HU-beta